VFICGQNLLFTFTFPGMKNFQADGTKRTSIVIEFEILQFLLVKKL